VNNILIVDDERPHLRLLTKGLAKYAKDFQVLTALNGKEAVKVLDTTEVDLVVTDLRMPEMDGFELLAHMSGKYPTIPVIVMTAYGTPDIEERLQNMGTFHYLEKPLDLNVLAGRIFDALDANSSPDRIHGVSLATVLQLLEMENKTCTLTVKSQGKEGHLYFIKGELMQADTGEMKDEAAALDIVTWGNVAMEIQYTCTVKKKSIGVSLAELLMDGFRIKDEKAELANGYHAEGIDKSEQEVKIMAIEEKLERFKDIEGFMGVGVFSRAGELLAAGKSSMLEMDMVGALVTTMVGNAQKTSEELGLGGSDEIDIVTKEGANIFVRCFSNEKVNFTLILICEKKAQIGIIRLRLNQVLPTLAEDLA
jgi:DNA-binding response OmpR family regulator/predicted regulator of Ras-like GTPase activity (Roadblock/LC7/MglB family)